MKINSLLIKNFKTIREMNIDDIEDALIIVGKNSTGKTTILHAILALTGKYEVKTTDFNSPERNIEIAVKLEISDEDIRTFYNNGVLSKYKTFSMWYEEFKKLLPTFERALPEEDEYYVPEPTDPDAEYPTPNCDRVIASDFGIFIRESFGEKQADQLMEAFRKVSEYYAR